MGNLVQFQTRGSRMLDQWLGFYTATQVARLAQMPVNTVYEWRRRGIIDPSIKVESAGAVADEGYSYADLTIIRILRELREDHINLTSAGVALRHLCERLGPVDSGWADAEVYFIGKSIFAYAPDEWDITDATRFGQTLFGDLFPELRQLSVGHSIVIPKQFRDSVEIDPKVMGGEPVVRNTRIPTGTLLDLADEGLSVAKIVRLYAPIPKKDIKAAIAYERFLDRAA
jgi:uncharacterized protein (DUF433 family)